MTVRGVSVWLPKAQALVCVKPGEELSDQEIEALEEYFLLIREARRVREENAEES